MIRLRPFDLEEPATLDQLCALLADDAGEGTRILAGGTDLIVNMKHGALSPQRVIWLGKLKELQGISYTAGSGLDIGAMCTLAEIASSPEVREHYPALAEAALSVASPAVRNAATIGGNICLDTRCYFYDQSEFWRAALGGCMKLPVPGDGERGACHAASGLKRCSAVFCSDLAPLLIAVDATILITGNARKRTIPLLELYRDDGISHLRLDPGEIVARVLLPPARPGQRSCHMKFRHRESVDFPLANLAVSLRMGPDRICRDVRIVVGAVHSTPVRALSVQHLLEGKEATPDLITRAGAEASSGVKPLPNLLAMAGMRKRLVDVLLQRALVRLAGPPVADSGRSRDTQ